MPLKLMHTKKRAGVLKMKCQVFSLCSGQFLLLVGVVVAREFCQNLSPPSELTHTKQMIANDVDCFPKSIDQPDPNATKCKCCHCHHNHPNFPIVPSDYQCINPKATRFSKGNMASVSDEEGRRQHPSAKQSNEATSSNVWQDGLRHCVKE